MTIESYTGVIQPNTEFATVESLTSVTFTAGKTYTMQIQNTAYIKIANAVFCVSNEKFNYTAGDEDLYIRVPAPSSCVLTILENEGE